MKQFYRNSLSVVLALAAVLSGCASGTAPSPSSSETASVSQSAASDSSQEAADSAENRYIQLKLDNEVASLDPHIATDTIAFTVIRAFTSSLFETDSFDLPQPILVEKAEKSADGLTYTYTLKEGKWNSGHPLSANDFVFAWQELIDPANGFQYSFYLDTTGILNAAEIIEGKKSKEELGVTALDDKTLEIKLAKPLPYFETI